MTRKSAGDLQFISLEERSQPRIRFVGVDVEIRAGDRFIVRVELEQYAGTTHMGSVAARGTGVARIPAAALATVKALRTAVGAGLEQLQLLDTGTVKVFATPAIVVSLVAHVGDESQQLVGFCVAEQKVPERAAALAVLNGVNRFLGAVTVENGTFKWKLPRRLS